MNLKEVFDQLSSGEFSQLSIGGEPAGVINSANFAQLVGHVNLGLTALYRRFALKQGELTLALQDDVSIYQLHSTYSVSKNMLGVPHYIIDTVEDPFKDDIIKVESVLSEGGTELPLNDAADDESLFTPSSLRLSVPGSYGIQNLTVQYKADHPKIKVTGGYGVVKETELELPPAYLEALLYFVASRVHNPVGMVNEFNAGNNYAAKYEQVCMGLELNGLDIAPIPSNERLLRNGWV